MKDNEEKESTIRVLLADDHAVVRAGIRQFLERAGDIQVIGEVSDGEHGYRNDRKDGARRSRPRYPDAESYGN